MIYIVYISYITEKWLVLKSTQKGLAHVVASVTVLLNLRNMFQA